MKRKAECTLRRVAVQQDITSNKHYNLQTSNNLCINVSAIFATAASIQFTGCATAQIGQDNTIMIWDVR